MKHDPYFRETYTFQGEVIRGLVAFPPEGSRLQPARTRGRAESPQIQFGECGGEGEVRRRNAEVEGKRESAKTVA